MNASRRRSLSVSTGAVFEGWVSVVPGFELFGDAAPGGEAASGSGGGPSVVQRSWVGSVVAATMRSGRVCSRAS